MENISFISVVILITGLVSVALSKINPCLIAFRIQSILIGICAIIIGVHKMSNEIIGIALIIILIKGVYLPKLLKEMYNKVQNVSGKALLMRQPFIIIIAGCIYVLMFYLVPYKELKLDSMMEIAFINALSLTFIGFLFMINRSKTIGQILGFLMIENGIFATALFATNGMPFIVDLGILVDLLTGVLVMGIIVYRIHENFSGIDTKKLKKLRG